MKYFVIVNPVSGRGLGEKSIPQIESFLREHNFDYTLARTTGVWHAAELAEGAARDGYDVIVCASGDGAINEALNGLMRAKKAGHNSVAFAALGIGTGNDFAGGAGIPTNLNDGLKALQENKRKRIDLGFVKGGDYPDGRYFGNGIGVGFDAAVGHEAIKVRWTRGLLAYLIGVIKTVFLYHNPADVEIVLDDGEIIRQRSLMISVMNGKRMGGGFQMAPDSEPDDGWFDLCIAETASKGRILAIIPHFIKGTQKTLPEIQMKRAKKVSIKSLDASFPAHADGEFICLEGSHLTLEILPQELEIIHA
ncbi:MAG: diacylglycerol kinase family lipid kinase [Chloroflexi bacterium CFX1]|nr:diacylglycerol kinase family lipid kinase [Chloroflexi bacterium CFX1]MCQ3951667.1 diacylglycerol kinase family lipid kinase [Chloroflexota bacterium]MDL1919025.1 diacylglycerol kinase family lipid kinase [Chloroflexi bacterium CFX5]NUQ57819.1 diacylglycerol kinase family lipid kinase [Anaerolineales bacterium]